MEYILNESAYKTTNGFKINNIKVDLDIPEITYINPINKEFNTRIGLSFPSYDEYTLTDDMTIEYSNNIGRVIQNVLVILR